MNKQLARGLIVRRRICNFDHLVAVSDALVEGGLALLASAVFGLAAGLCIGALIAANFAMLACEESEYQVKVTAPKEAHATA